MENAKQIIQAIYEVFIGFLIVDGDVNESEVDILFLEFFDYLKLYFPGINPEVSFEETIKKIGDNPDNFLDNANFLSLTITKEQKIGVLSGISQIIFSDDDFNDYEYHLFTNLMIIWDIKKEDLDNL